jgi:hypothetical protein
VLGYTAHEIDIYAVADQMAGCGWFVSRAAEPRGIHMGMLTMVHVPVVERYLDDLRASVAAVRAGGLRASNTKASYGG